VKKKGKNRTSNQEGGGKNRSDFPKGGKERRERTEGQMRPNLRPEIRVREELPCLLGVEVHSQRLQRGEKEKKKHKLIIAKRRRLIPPSLLGRKHTSDVVSRIIRATKGRGGPQHELAITRKEGKEGAEDSVIRFEEGQPTRDTESPTSKLPEETRARQKKPTP